MAQSISIESGSVLIGSPIEVLVQAESVGRKATFHRVKLIVSAALSTDGQYEDFELSAPVTDGEQVSFDISDTLRTVAGKFTYSPITQSATYPYISYTLKAYDEYMIDGILHEKVAERVYGSTMYALMGYFTDAERFLSEGVKSVTRFTRKPLTGEVCSQQENVVYPLSLSSPIDINSVIDSGPKVEIMPLSDKEGAVSVGDREIYVDINAKNRISFQFVNGFGVVESISAETLEAVETSGTSEVIAKTAPASFKNVNRMMARKSTRTPKIRMSTGSISQEWAEWWHNEFLDQSDNFRRSLSQSCWINIDGHWWPCVAMLEDDTTIYDKTEDGMIKIDFVVHLAINGLTKPIA